MKKWLINTLSSVFATIFIIVLLNYIMDPMWTFEHQHPYNQYQRASKERQQKSHSIYFNSHRYNTLLLGSSRTTFMNQEQLFNKGDVFNYAFSDMTPREYMPYIDFAIKEAKQPIKRIILGLDFFGALEYHPFISTQTATILSSIRQEGYRWKLLCSYSALNYSIKNIQYYLQKRPHTYNRNNIKHFPENNQTPEEYRRNNLPALKGYEQGRFASSYDNSFKMTLLSLKQKYPYIEFMAYTTPVSLEHFKLLIDTNHYKDYERWLREATEVFGTVHHFMYLNKFTKHSEKYFSDSHHPLENTTISMIQQIQGRKTIYEKTDFKLNYETIDIQLQELKDINFNNGIVN